MKKRTKIILTVIASIVLLGIIFGTTDYIRVKNNKLPIFTIHVSQDSNWEKYYGLGYVVVKNDDCRGDYSNFGSYFATYACFMD